MNRNLQEERGLSEEQARHLLTEMRKAFPESAVIGYERLTGSMTNDPGDRHVLATAVHAGAQVIVTDNLRDFPERALAPYNIEPQTPDEFLEHLYDLDPEQMARIVVELNAARKRPPESLDATLDRIAKAAPRFVAQVQGHPTLALRLRPMNP